jgi:predicted RNA-binding protein with PUA-like domain
LQQHADALGDFALTRRGNRLSVLPVSQAQWDYIFSCFGINRPDA